MNKITIILSVVCITSLLNIVNSIIVGEATYYNDQGYGACGSLINANSQLLVAVPPSYWTTANPNNDPICNAQVKVNYNGKSIVLPVRDKCPSCPSNNIDISAPAFIQLAGGLDLGRIGITWELVNVASTTSGSSTTTGGSKCSKKAIVSQGQGCYDVWISKCGNIWNENVFYSVNPGVVCVNLQIGQLLCCN